MPSASIEAAAQSATQVSIALTDAMVVRFPVSADPERVRSYAHGMLPPGTQFDHDAGPEPDSVAFLLVAGTTDARVHGGARPCHLLFVALESSTASNTDAGAFLCPYVFVDDLEVLGVLSEQLGHQAWRSTFALGADGLRLTTEVYAAREHAAKEGDVLLIRFDGEAGPIAWLQRQPKEMVQLLQVREAGRPAVAALQALRCTQVSLEGLDHERERPRQPGSAQLASLGAFRNLDLHTDLGLSTGPLDPGGIEGFCAQRIALAPQPREGAHARGRLRRADSGAFIEARVDPRAPPPYRFEQVSVTGFKFPADRDRLQALVDVLLNGEEQNFRYQVATPEVVVEYLEYPRMFATLDTRWRKREDYTYQQELAVRLLVGKTEEDSDVATEPRVFCPLLFVSNWASMLSGREVMGLWKRMARFCPQRLFCADPSEDEMSPALGDPVERRVMPLLGSGLDVDPCAGMLAPQWDRDECVLVIQHAAQPRWADDALPLAEMSGSRAQGVLPWRQQDFRHSIQFRRAFARDWLRVSGAEYRAVQRLRLHGRHTPEYDQWVEAHYRVGDFRVYQPEGPATLCFGRYWDAQLAALLAAQGQLGDCIDAHTQYIDVAQLLGLPRARMTIPAAAWYLGRGNFEVEAVYRYA